jgi:hypothetical protein
MDKAKRSVEYPPRSPDLTPLHVYVWGDLKNAVGSKIPRTLQDLRYKTEIASAAIRSANLRHVAHSHQQCFGAGGGTF